MKNPDEESTAELPPVPVVSRTSTDEVAELDNRVRFLAAEVRSDIERLGIKLDRLFGEILPELRDLRRDVERAARRADGHERRADNHEQRIAALEAAGKAQP